MAEAGAPAEARSVAGTPAREPELLVDPIVSRAKFERELAAYRALERDHQRRGWWMLDAAFPTVFVVFAAPQLKPATVIFAAEIDFDNYDLWPPAVRLVDPFSRQPIKARDAPHPFPLWTGDKGPDGKPVVQPLLQALSDEDEPFICLPGVRQYHENPGHTDDPWLLRRGRGEGTLYWTLDQLWRHGIVGIEKHRVEFAVQLTDIKLAGYLFNPPE